MTAGGCPHRAHHLGRKRVDEQVDAQDTIVFFFFWLHGMGDLSSPTRDQTCAPCIGNRKS